MSLPPDHDPMLDPVVDPVLEPVTDEALDPATDPAARPATDPRDADPAVVDVVVDVRNRFGVRGLRDMVRLGQAELQQVEEVLDDLDPRDLRDRA